MTNCPQNCQMSLSQISSNFTSLSGLALHHFVRKFRNCLREIWSQFVHSTTSELAPYHNYHQWQASISSLLSSINSLIQAASCCPAPTDQTVDSLWHFHPRRSSPSNRPNTHIDLHTHTDLFMPICVPAVSTPKPYSYNILHFDFYSASIST